MSLVVVNVSSGPTTTTLPLINDVPGRIITIKDSGSASVSNTITIVPTAGNTFEIGTSYILNTPLAYATFIGNATTLKWRVLGITNPDIPAFTSTIVNSNMGVIGGAGVATLNTLTVSGATTLGNSSNTGTLGVAGTLTVAGNTSLGNSSNTGTLGVAGTLAVAGTATVGALATTSGFAQVTNLGIETGRGICFDASGNMYVNTSYSGTIYKITPQGVTSLLAGTFGISGTTDGTGSAALFADSMQQMIYDSYTGCIITTNRTTLRLITLTGVVITIASGFTYLAGVCSDGAGNFYVSDLSIGVIKKVVISSTTPAANSGVVTTIAGTGTSGYYNATGTAATFNQPYHLVINSSKTALYLAEYGNHVIRQITLPGYVVTTYAGPIGSSATPGNTTPPAQGIIDSATPGSVRFTYPVSIAIDASNNLYVGDYANNRIRFISTSPFYTLTLAGDGGASYVEGVGANSQVATPHALSIGPNGSLWIMGYNGGCIMNYNRNTGYLSIYYRPAQTLPTPINIQNTAISTIVAPAITTGTLYGSGFTVTNSNAANPGGATYQSPNGVLMDSQNNLYVGDNRRLRKISPSRLVTSIYGDVTNTQGTTQPGRAVQGVSNILYQSMCFDNSGNMYISQYTGNSILKLNLLTGVATTLSITVGSGSLALNGPNGLLFNNNTLYVMNQNPGNSENSYLLSINLLTNTSSKMAGNDGTFNYAFSICFDLAKTNIYVSNYGGTNIKIVNISNNAVTTFTTSGLAGLTPLYITIDNLGNFYCSGTYTGIPVTRGIIKITSAGVASSFCNTVTINGASVNLNAPQGLAVDSYNNVYFADAGLYIVGYVSPAGTASLYSGVNGSSSTQDSTYASSITLMAPYVGINTSNPTAALHVNGNANVSGNVSHLRQILGNTSGYLLADNAFLSDQWNMTLNAYTSNGAWVVPTASIGTSRFQIQGAQFTWYWGAAGAAPTTQLMQLNTGGLYVNSNIYLPLGTSGVGISAQSFTTRANIGDTINNAPSYGMGVTSGFPGLGSYSGANQPVQIASYYGINFVGGTGNWGTGASHMCIVDGKVGIQNRNPQYALDVNGTMNVNASLTVGNNGQANSLDIWGPAPFSGARAIALYGDIYNHRYLQFAGADLYVQNAAGTGVYLPSGNTSWSSTSDERLKENITPIVNALDFCASLRTVKYSLIRENLSTPNKIGFIAQDFVNEYSEVINIDRNNNLALAYTETIPIAFAAIKEQKIIVDAQASTITGVQTNAETQSSTIAGLQTDTLTQSSTITQVQTNTEAQSSTITGLQATIDSQASTIVAILAKYPLDI